MPRYTKEEIESQRNRLHEEKYNNQGYLMRVVEYGDAKNIVVEFQDAYKAKVHTSYRWFLLGKVKNPYHCSAYSVGMVGEKYPMSLNGIHIKEYVVWRSILRRCFDDKFKETHKTYKDAICCNEWLLYENFYEWLHNQPNFDKWINGDKWAVDKDIIVKGNKIYSPETCTLVPYWVNSLFLKRDAKRGDLPIGVSMNGKGYQAYCNNLIENKRVGLGTYSTIEQAFQVYKQYKENIIKKVAQEEYSNGNITKECYDAMIRYKVEIAD